MTTTTTFDPFSPAFQQDPYPCYAELREHAPVAWVEPVGAWAVSRYEDVLRIFQDHDTYSNSAFIDMAFGEYFPAPTTAGVNMVAADPPDHTRLRRLANRAFLPSIIRSLESHVREITNQLIDDVENRGEFDFMEDLAALLPTSVVADMLGVDTSLRHQFVDWTRTIVGAATRASKSEAELAHLRQSSDAMGAYVQEAIERRRREPADDLVGRLIQAEDDDVLSPGELASTTAVILLGGVETTPGLIGNMMVHLFGDPELLAKVEADRSLIRPVTEETLRHNSPVQLSWKQTKAEVVIHGVTIPAGTGVLPLIGSANRDDRHFTDPDVFNINRTETGHLSFGQGIHFCIGSMLTRMEVQVFFDTLFSRLPSLRLLESEVAWHPSFSLRHPQALMVAAR